jgi:hypothetical protein
MTSNSNKSASWFNNFSVLLSWRLFTAQHVSGVFPPIIRSSMTAVAAFGFTFVSWWQSCCVRGRVGRSEHENSTRTASYVSTVDSLNHTCPVLLYIKWDVIDILQRVWIPLHTVFSIYCFMSLFATKHVRKMVISFPYISKATPNALWPLLFLIYRVTASLSSSDRSLSHPRCVRCIALMCGSNYSCITWVIITKTKRFVH